MVQILLPFSVFSLKFTDDKCLQSFTNTAFKVVAYGDSEDWKDYGTDSIIKSVVDNKHLGNGSIILLHCGTKYTAEALEDVITGLQEKGYELVPVSELIYTGEYKVDQMGRQIEK